MKLLRLFGLLLLTNSAFAALPPAAESLRRIKMITESKELYEQLDSADWVETITQTEHGYLVQTQKCQVLVDVVPIDKQPSHPRLMGPLPLMVKVQKKECH